VADNDQQSGARPDSGGGFLRRNDAIEPRMNANDRELNL
jgi:hypothetical protein